MHPGSLAPPRTSPGFLPRLKDPHQAPGPDPSAPRSPRPRTRAPAPPARPHGGGCCPGAGQGAPQPRPRHSHIGAPPQAPVQHGHRPPVAPARPGPALRPGWGLRRPRPARARRPPLPLLGCCPAETWQCGLMRSSPRDAGGEGTAPPRKGEGAGGPPPSWEWHSGWRPFPRSAPARRVGVGGSRSLMKGQVPPRQRRAVGSVRAPEFIPLLSPPCRGRLRGPARSPGSSAKLPVVRHRGHKLVFRARAGPLRSLARLKMHEVFHKDMHAQAPSLSETSLKKQVFNRHRCPGLSFLCP